MTILFEKSSNLINYIDCNVHNSCPVCNHIMQPEILVLHKKEVYGEMERVLSGSQGDETVLFSEVIELLSNIVLKCTAYDCEKVFIAHYKSKPHRIDSVKYSM